MSICKLVLCGALGLIAVSLVTLPASARPNFSGIWLRDAAASGSYTAVLASVIGSNRNLPGSPFILRVNHRGSHLQIAIEENGHGSGTAAYSLGRGWHGNVGPEFGGSKYRPSWKGDTLAIEKFASYRGYDSSIQGSVYQEWVLSYEDRILTITTTVQPNALVTKEVFIKK
jgi:hypothetical protein